MTRINVKLVKDTLKHIPEGSKMENIILIDASTPIETPLQSTLAKISAIGKKVELQGPSEDMYRAAHDAEC